MTLDEIRAAASRPGSAWGHPLDGEALDPATVRVVRERDGHVTSFVARSTKPGRRWFRFLVKLRAEPPERWWKTSHKTRREALEYNG